MGYDVHINDEMAKIIGKHLLEPSTEASGPDEVVEKALEWFFSDDFEEILRTGRETLQGMIKLELGIDIDMARYINKAPEAGGSSSLKEFIHASLFRIAVKQLAEEIGENPTAEQEAEFEQTTKTWLIKCL